MSRPRFVALRLAVPRMGSRGGDEAALIRLVQARLLGLAVDGLYGCATSAAVQRWQWQQGSPNTSGAITPAELLVLLDYRRRPAEWWERARLRLIDGRWGPTPNPVLERCVEADARPALDVRPRPASLQPPRGVYQRASHAPSLGAVAHYIGPGRSAVGLGPCVEQLVRFQAGHLRKGWLDIGYSFAIPRGTPPGLVLTLRGFGARGAHSGHNAANALIGVLVMFGTEDPGPDDDQLATLGLFCAEHARGRLTGHQEWSATACPGVMQRWVERNRHPR